MSEGMYLNSIVVEFDNYSVFTLKDESDVESHKKKARFMIYGANSGQVANGLKDYFENFPSEARRTLNVYSGMYHIRSNSDLERFVNIDEVDQCSLGHNYRLGVTDNEMYIRNGVPEQVRIVTGSRKLGSLLRDALTSHPESTAQIFSKYAG